MSNHKVTDYIPGTREVLNTELGPCELLVAAIFQRAILDLRDPEMRSEIIQFARSPWCQTLLGGGVEPGFVEKQFKDVIRIIDTGKDNGKSAKSSVFLTVNGEIRSVTSCCSILGIERQRIYGWIRRHDVSYAEEKIKKMLEEKRGYRN